jgi:hypothetical protein
MRAKCPRRACYLEGAEVTKLQRIDQLVKHSLHQLDVTVWSLDVNRGATQTHRHAELGLERAQVGATRAGELEQQTGIGNFDVGGYIGLNGAALRSRFDIRSLACPGLGREPQC